MLRRRRTRNFAFLIVLIVLTILGDATSACAQGDVGAPRALPAILNSKQAAHLILVYPKPEYPPVAKVNYLQGHVQLRLTVSNEGKVTRAHVLQGDAVLAASALKAVRDWIYRPLRTPDGPAGFLALVKLKYTLNSNPSELTPQRAEQDFLRQVKPPQAVPPQQNVLSGDVVHLRVLVNDQGIVDDMEVSPPETSHSEVPNDALRGWTFHAARWGNLPVASYVEVEVPMAAQSLAPTNAAVALDGR